MKNLITVLGQTIEKKDAYKLFTSNGYKHMVVDIQTAPFGVNPRFTEQIVDIPENKRGNLSAFKGKKVSVYTTTVAGNGGARINFYIKEITR